MILPFREKYPKVDPSAYIVDNAMVIGDVEIGAGTNIWFYCIVRGDTDFIRIGSNCNIQDACVLHVSKNTSLIVEDEVVMGHRVVVHACKIGRGSMIGIGAVVLNGAEIGEESIIGAGAVVTPNTIIPPKTLAFGNPAKPIRPLGEEDLNMVRQTLQRYQGLKEVYQSFFKINPL
jgi:carbonic anhydrase/acetyltransferase-like protein (isoleucine patch superfamily)